MPVYRAFGARGAAFGSVCFKSDRRQDSNYSRHLKLRLHKPKMLLLFIPFIYLQQRLRY